MAGETLITLIGNLTADPELRFTPSGAPVANFTVASTPRTFDRQSGEWRDGDAMFLNCAVWRQYAENVAESLQKGMRVVQGRLKSRSYETREGERRTVFEIDVEEIGPALRYATAKVTRSSGGGGGGGGYGGGNSGGGGSYGGNQAGANQGVGRQGGQGNDPWSTGGNQGGASPTTQGGGDPWGAAPSDEPPF
jgi:single-strand DNA-binding protein